MSNEQIGPGSVVQLKSGGLRMTVTEIEDGNATTTWFDDKKSVQWGVFPLVALRIYRDPGPTTVSF
mgnify:CR=1 FL=1